MIPPEDSESDPLQELAWTLAKNHFDTSVPDYISRSPQLADAASRLVFTRGRRAGPPERTILVIGSGASIATFGQDDFPGTARARQRLNRELRLTHHALRGFGARIRRRKLQIQQAYAYEDAPYDFETHLAALSEIFTQERVAGLLSRMYSKRYRPHIVFEIIAHLFRHRFFDVVVNFNFDELLDQAVVAEMGTGEYHRIISDADCGSVTRYIVEERLKIPLYIKPHGTARQPTSMRFTKDHYHQLPPPLRRLLGDVVAGRWEDGARRRKRMEERRRSGAAQNEKAPYPVNLVTIGFGMKSLDLLALLRNAVAEGTQLTLFHIDLEECREPFHRVARQLEAEGTHVEQRFIPVAREGEGALPGVVRRLWNLTGSQFQTPFRPRGIARHEIIHALFHAPAAGDERARRVPTRHADYFQARLYVELAINLARGNGNVDLALASATRLGVYFDRMWGAERRIPMQEILAPFASGGRYLDPARTVFRMRSPEADYPEDADENLARYLWDSLGDALLRIQDAPFQAHVARVRQTQRNEMIDRFCRLSSSDSKDIDPSFKYSQLILSRTPALERVLHTSLALTLRFVEMLNQDWDVMLVVSELGKVIDKYLDHCNPVDSARRTVDHDPASKEFCVVVTSNDRPDLTSARLQRVPGRMLGYGAELAYFDRPREMATQHMVLLLKRSDGDLHPVSGISFRKIGLQNRVNPVYLDESCADELRDAVDCFRSYVHESVRAHLEARGRVGELPTPEESWRIVVDPPSEAKATGTTRRR